MGGREDVPLGTRLVSELKRRWQLLVGVSAVVVGVALAVIAAGVLTRNDAEPRVPDPGIVGGVTLSPRILLFGDPLNLRVDVVVDRRRVTPHSVRFDSLQYGLEEYFRPFEPAGLVLRTQRDEGDLTRITWTATLECLTARCLPRMTEKRELVHDSNLRIAFRRRSRAGSFEDIIGLPLPTIGLASRLNYSEIQQSREANPVRAFESLGSSLTAEDVVGLWRESSEQLPETTYRISPALLIALLLTLAAALTASAAWLVVRQFRPAPVVAAPAPVGLPVSSLEHALDQLERALSNGKPAEQRKALELVAREIGRNGDEALAREARHLAWAEDDPAEDRARSLAASVREVIERENGDST